MKELLFKIFKAIYEVFKNEQANKKTIDKEDDKKTNQDEVVLVPLEKQISDFVNQIIQKGVGNPLTNTPYMNFRETEGKNRSKDIDALILRNGGELGDLYCMYGVQDILRAIELKFKIKFDLPKTGSTQDFFTQTKEAYKVSSPIPFSICIFKLLKGTGGHAALCLNKPDQNTFTTFEFNTSPQIGEQVERNGEGCYFKSRPLHGYSNMVIRGYVDIFKAIKK